MSIFYCRTNVDGGTMPHTQEKQQLLIKFIILLLIPNYIVARLLYKHNMLPLYKLQIQCIWIISYKYVFLIDVLKYITHID